MVRISSLKCYASKVQYLSENSSVYKVGEEIIIQRQSKTYLRYPKFPEDMFSRQPSFFLLDIKGLGQKLNLYMPKYRKDSHPVSNRLGR